MNFLRTRLLPSLIFIYTLYMLLVTSYRVVYYFYSLRKMNFGLVEKETKKIKTYANLVSDFFNEVQTKISDLSIEIKSADFDKTQIAALVDTKFKFPSNILGVGILKEAADGFLIINKNEKRQVVDLKPLKKEEINFGWSGPIHSKDYNSFFIRFAMPYLAPSSTGIIFADVSFDSLKDLLLSFDIGLFGICAIIANDGTFLFHNYEKIPKSHLDFSKIPFYKDSPKIVKFFKEASLGKSIGVHFYNKLIEREVFAASHKIDIQGEELEGAKKYSLVLFIAKNDVFSESTDFINKNFMKLMVSLVITFILLSFFIFRVYKVDFYCSSNWTRSIIAILLVAILLIWYRAYNSDVKLDKDKIILIDPYFFKNADGVSLDKLPPIKQSVLAGSQQLVPLGIILRNIDFPDSSHVQLNGYMWAKFPKDAGVDFDKEIVLSDSVYTKEFLLLSDTEEGDKRVLVWNFICLLSQESDYFQYPLDKKVVKINIIPRSIGKFVFIPAFSDYFNFSSLLKPGMVDNLEVVGWTPEATFFSYEKTDFKSDLGEFLLERNGGEIYSMYFNISLRREILDSLLSELFPLLVAMYMLFVMLVLKKASDILSTVSALFFVILYAHLALRTKLSFSGITYIEYFFIFGYLMLYLVVLSQILTTTKDYNIGFLRYKDNTFTKLFYWPIFLGLCFTISVLLFY